MYDMDGLKWNGLQDKTDKPDVVGGGKRVRNSKSSSTTQKSEADLDNMRFL